MKKSYCGLLFILLMLSLILIGCNGQFSNNEQVHLENYGYIHVVSLKKGNIELYIQNSICNTKEQAKRIFEILADDYDALKEAFDLDTTVKICMIEDTYILGDSHGAFMDGIVYCNPDIVESGEYCLYLTAAYLETTEPWKYYGARAYVFGDTVDNSDLLSAYYSDENNLLTLSLFAAYFNDSFSDAETKDVARKTAAQFSKYVIDRYGMDKFLDAGLQDYRQEWLGTLGVDRTFDVPYDLSWLDGAEYSQRILQYPLVIETENRTYHLDSVSAEMGFEEYAFDTPALVLEHLSKNNAQIETILSYIEAQASEIYPDIKALYDEKIEYFISEKEYMTGADSDKKEVYLKEIGEYVHETMHVVFTKTKTYEAAWLDEGVAEYFSRYISRSNTAFEKRLVETFNADLGSNAELKEFRDCIMEYYTAHGGAMSDIEEFDRALFQEAVAYVTLKNPEYKTVDGFSYGTLSVADRTNRPVGTYEGNDLTYCEAYLFTKYLIDTYDMGTVLSALLSEDLNVHNSFGKTYEELFTDFLTVLFQNQNA